MQTMLEKLQKKLKVTLEANAELRKALELEKSERRSTAASSTVNFASDHKKEMEEKKDVEREDEFMNFASFFDRHGRRRALSRVQYGSSQVYSALPCNADHRLTAHDG